MLDDLKHYAKYAGLWLTTRGVVALAVLPAAIGMGLGAWSIPLITMPIGLGLATYLTYDRSNYLKNRVKNAYKLELAATLEKDPKEVTVQDLSEVAHGDKEAGLPGNKILHEQLDRIDKHRNFSMVSTAAAIGLAGITLAALLGGGFEHLLEPFENLANMINGKVPVISNTEIFAAGMAASGVSITTDYALSQVGNHIFGLDKKTAYDMIQDLKKERREGKDISPAQVTSVILTANPKLNKRIEKTYHMAFADMEPWQQADVIDAMDTQYGIRSLTEKINADRFSANEVAFVADGQISGLPERDPQIHKRRVQIFLPGIFAGRGSRETTPPVAATVEVTENGEGKVVEAHTVSRQDMQDSENRTSFVERYVTESAIAKGESRTHVERLMDELHSEHSRGA